MKQNEETIVLNFRDYIVYIDKALREITISSNDIYAVSIVLSEIEILDIALGITDSISKFKVGNKEISLSSDNCVFIDEIDKGIKIPTKEIFTIVKCLKEITDIMNESSTTQDIYNTILNSNSNNPAGEIIKPIEATGQQPKSKLSVYDSIINAINKESKGGTDNESK